MQNRIPSLSTPIVTPFDKSQQFDEKQFGHLLDHLTTAGVEGIMIGGTTGEFASLSLDELLQVVAVAVDRVHEDTVIMVGGAPCAISAAHEWVTRIGSAGADAGVVTAPYFHTSNSVEGMVRYFEILDEASEIPLMAYNIPTYVGEVIPLEVLERIAMLNNFIGLKDSSGDLAYGLRALEVAPDDFTILQGYDPLLIPSLRMGFDGGVNLLSNLVPKTYLAITDDPTSEASQIYQHRVIEPLFDLCDHYGFAAGIKAALTVRGWLSSTSVRPPLQKIPAQEIEPAVRDVLELTPPSR
jgi:4-hydroxy-tetrahydrodipicolinate synthase